jgi:hypothetical protein
MLTRTKSDPAAHFDYDSLSRSVAIFLKGQAERIRRGCTSSVIQAGKALIESKRHLSHGAFLRWVQAEVGLPIRTAQAYMRVAQWAKGRNAAITHLPPSLLYLLSAPSTPEEFSTNILERLETGERLDVNAARAELKASRHVKSNGPHEGAATLKPAPAVGPQASAGTRGASPTLFDAILILWHALPSRDFMFVRQAMTSRYVLGDPQLAKNITDAFLAVDNLDRNGKKIERLAPAGIEWGQGSRIDQAEAQAAA